jgi:hypothetical protein
MKPDTRRVFNYLWRTAHRKVPSSELMHNLRTVDYRARVSEIRKFLREDDILRVESKRIPGRAINYYRIIEAPRRSA